MTPTAAPTTTTAFVGYVLWCGWRLVVAVILIRTPRSASVVSERLQQIPQ